jgi:hypothetical protein
MRVIVTYTFETAEAHWVLSICRRDGLFVGEFVGMAPKNGSTMQAPLIRDIGAGELTDTNIKRLVAACREEIERLAGPIEREI